MGGFGGRSTAEARPRDPRKASEAKLGTRILRLFRRPVFQVFIVAVVILISSTFAVFALSRPWVGHVLLGDGAYQTAVAVDSTGAIHVVIADTSLLYATNAGGGWTTTPVFSWSDSLTSAVATAIAVAPSGAVSITVSYGLFGLIYYLTNSTGSWTRSELTSSADLGGTASFPVDTAPVAIDAAGTVHAAFSVYNRSTNTTSVIHAENSKGNWAWD